MAPKKSDSTMLSSTRVIYQNLVDAGSDGRLEVVLVKMSSLNEDHADLRSLVERNEGRPLGLSGAFSPKGTLQVLAVADATTVILIDFTGDKNNGRADSSDPSLTTPGRDYLCDHVLGRTCGFLYAFDMAPLALALWQSHDLRIKQAIDIQSAGPPTTRAPFATIKFASDHKLNEGNVVRTFDDFICQIPDDAANPSSATPLAQRAWAAHYVSQLQSMEERLAHVPPIDTARFTEAVISFRLFHFRFRLIQAFSSSAFWPRVLQTLSKEISSSQLKLPSPIPHLLMMERTSFVSKLIATRTGFVKAKIK
ncbi:hypothetical protein HD554DRAFT_581626 [Boletus coccyginus]|nr:hypothetical protein HD554DRAFT_581626 [Boletus coccyginus]